MGVSRRLAALSVHQDDASYVTVPVVTIVIANKNQAVKKTLKLWFISSSEEINDNMHIIHLRWIQVVQDKYLGSEVQIANNNDQPMPKVDTFHWTIRQHNNKWNRLPQGLDSASNRRGRILIIYLHLLFSVSGHPHLSKKMKNVPKMMQLLRDHQCFSTEHRWLVEDTWDMTRLGVLCGSDPQVYDIVNAT